MTRPEPGASATAEQLTTRGWQAIKAPMLAIRPMQVALPRPASLQAVLVASGNAVALPPSFHATLLLAVGDATARRARQAGFAQVQSAGGDAAALADLAGRLLDPAGLPILVATGRGEGTTLIRSLRKRGFAVHRRAVYSARAVRHFPPDAAQALAAGVYACLFFSTETARAFARTLPAALLPSLHTAHAAVIGPGVAAAVGHLPWRSLRVAVRPTQDEVLALL